MIEISSRADLKEWLENKPQDWGRLLAHRMVLRVVPVLNQAIGSPNLKIDLKSQLTLSVLRIPLSSEVAVYTSNPEIRDALRDIATAALNFHDVSAAGRVVYTAYVAYSIPGIMNASDVARVESAADTVYTLHTKGVARIGSAALNHDVQWLEVNGLEEKHRQKFLGLPLWHGQSNPLETNWQDLKHALQAMDPNWQFWTDWYQAKLDGTLHPGLTQVQQEYLYYQIATFPRELWEEGAEVVNQRIAELMKNYEGDGKDFFLHDGFLTEENQNDTTSQKVESNSDKTEQFRTLVNSPEFRSNIEQNKVPIKLICANLLIEVAACKEKIRQSNSLFWENPEAKNDLLATLAHISEAIEGIQQAVGEVCDPISDDKLEDAAKWFQKFQKGVSENLDQIIDPENASRGVVPITLVIGCGILGSILGGVAASGVGFIGGFAAGSHIGKTLDDKINPDQNGK